MNDPIPKLHKQWERFWVPMEKEAQTSLKMALMNALDATITPKLEKEPDAETVVTIQLPRLEKEIQLRYKAAIDTTTISLFRLITTLTDLEKGDLTPDDRQLDLVKNQIEKTERFLRDDLLFATDQIQQIWEEQKKVQTTKLGEFDYNK